jgi:ATP-binding cassette subfamily B protein
MSQKDKYDKKIAPAGAVFRVYWEHAKKYPKTIWLMMLGGVAIQATFLVGPLYLRQFFNLLASNHPNQATLQILLHILVIVVSIWLIEWASRRVSEWAVMYFQTHVMRDLSNSAFDYLLGHSYNFFVSSFAGSLTHKVSRFSRSFERLADAVTLQFIPTFLFVTGAIVVLFVRQPVLGGALLVWSLAFIWFQVWVAGLRQPYRVAASEADTKVTATLADAISNQNTIALFSGTSFERGTFSEVVASWRVLTAKLWIADGWIWSGIGLFMIAIEGGLIYGALIYWSRGLLTIGDFVLIQSYLLVTFDRLVAINRELRGFYSALADGGEMVAILQTPHEIRDRKGAKVLQVNKGEVWFDDVSFNFHKGTPVLREFNLTIAGGERVALVGPSGAGKSTVTKLLLRLYDVPQGEIKIDGQNIADVTQDSLRDAIAFVPQEPILFHRTLMENIRYGRRTATDAEVIEAAQKAHCHEFIQKLPLGYDTFVGERGIKLSGGERQRVAIARAILKDAPILVLDEATSSLDSESEAYIQDALNILMEGKTVVVIAHRLSTIMKMDRIVVMEQGQIVAQGTHLQLIKEKGLYQKLWSIQAGGFLGGAEDDETTLKENESDEDELAEDEEEE